MKKNLLLLLALLAGVSSGENMWHTHGHSYSYNTPSSFSGSRNIFPVVWDTRSAPGLLDTWQRIYAQDNSSPLFSILEESYQSGFNAVILRSALADNWFPEIPGSEGDDFFPRAHAARTIGLHLVLGGLKTDLFAEEHNQAVIDYLDLYQEMTEGQYPGEIIGMFAFDEPDVKYMEDPQLQPEWISFVDQWSNQCRERLGLNVIAYTGKYGAMNPDGTMEYYSDTTNVLNRIARFVDAVGMDPYPAKNNFRRTDLLEMDHSGAVFVAATDLVLEDMMYADAMAAKDEIVHVFPEGDSARVTIDLVSWDRVDLHVEPYTEISLGFLPDGFASSDFRSGLVLYQGSLSLNSGVLLWDSNQSVEEAILIRSLDGVPSACSLNSFSGSENYTPVFASVGQADFWADHTEMSGVIGKGRLVIALGLKDRTGSLFLQLYTSQGSETVPVFQSPEPLGFPVEGAFWGTFWGTWYELGTLQAAARNGFILYGSSGEYITLQQVQRDLWQFSPDGGSSRYSNLFGGNELPDFIRVSRVDGDYPPLFAGRDMLIGYFKDKKEIVSAMSMESDGPLALRDTIAVTDIEGDITAFDLFRNDHLYSDRPLFTTSSGDVFYGSGSMRTGAESGSIAVKPVRYCSGTDIMAPLRPMHARDAIRSALVLSDDGYYMPHCELYADVVDHARFQWYPNIHRTGMQIGVKSTERDNVSFGVIQSWGRHSFALPSYCASPDTMLYMVTTPVVEGARGLVFYALDLSMMCGNGGDNGITRAPWVLQNWGPSRDTENVDMIGRIHDTVAELAGRTGGTDYLSILVDSSWTVLSDERAVNIHSSDSLLNFIALESSDSDSIVIIAVNIATSETPFPKGIVLEGLPPAFSISSWSGWKPSGPVQVTEIGGESITTIDYSGMPTLTASLVTLTSQGSSECQGSWLRTASDALGNTRITFSLCSRESGTLEIYDLTGRPMRNLWSGEGSGTQHAITVSRGDLPSGMYFAVLRAGDRIETGKCVLW
ncbi:hypothetical protein CSA37_03600 [Candidatus Fermentibacteria bacterium]|nr:MAG: hypothetical protein CSA37_03600 [Candidatus Fermentibacteria bacterium]